MVMGHGFGWVKLGMGGGGFWLGLRSRWVGGGFCGGGGGFCGGCWYWSEAGLRWWLAMVSHGCGLCHGLRKMERQWERERERERQRESEK